MNNGGFEALRAYATTPEYYGGPPATISLAETSLLTPTSPESFTAVNHHDDSDRKPTKKRKSWGQELPTPKTNLPPRKRAKTEDEKEQRRIERVLRNRQAAQSSRERKRQEVEKLEGEKYAIERQNYMLKQRLMQVEHDKYRLSQQVAKMAAALLKSGATTPHVSKAPSPSSPPSPTLTADLLQHDQAIKQELEDYPFSLPSPQNTLDPRSSFSSASSSSSRSPSPTHMEYNGSATSPDMTQHPAAMLCGLQCQSGAAWPPLSIPATTPHAEAPSPSMRAPPTLTQLPLFLALHSAVSLTLLHPLNQIFISLKTGLPLPTATRMTPMLFLLIQWLISTPVNPLTSATATIPTTPLSLSTSTTTTATTTSTSSRPPLPPSTFRISLLRRLLACSPALARPLKDATGRALQMKTRYALRGISTGGSANGTYVDGVRRCGNSLVASVNGDARPAPGGWEFLMTLSIAIDHIEREKQKQKARRKGRSRC